MDYELKLGIITRGRTLAVKDPNAFQPSSSNSYQVRIMPDMADINDTDTDSGNLMLPWYPNFFANIHTAYQPGDLVWIACDDDYHVGFIVGLAQTPNGDDTQSLLKLLNDAEFDAKMTQSAMNELTIQKISDTCLTFSNVNTGRVSHIYNSKTIYIFNEDGSFYSRNGNNYTFIVDKNGNITETAKGDIILEIKGNHELHASKSTESISTKEVHTASNYSINSGGNISITAAGKLNLTGTAGITVAGIDVTLLGGLVKVFGVPIIV